MSRRLVKVRSVRTADGKPSMLPRVSNPADALTAPGWTVHTEPSPILVGLGRLARWLLSRFARGLLFVARLLAVVTVRGVHRLSDRAGPLRRCSGCGLWLRTRSAVGLVDVRTGSHSCPVTGVPHAPWAVLR
jgi:hypothetical protein